MLFLVAVPTSLCKLEWCRQVSSCKLINNPVYQIISVDCVLAKASCAWMNSWAIKAKTSRAHLCRYSANTLFQACCVKVGSEEKKCSMCKTFWKVGGCCWIFLLFVSKIPIFCRLKGQSFFGLLPPASLYFYNAHKACVLQGLPISFTKTAGRPWNYASFGVAQVYTFFTHDAHDEVACCVNSCLVFCSFSKLLFSIPLSICPSTILLMLDLSSNLGFCSGLPLYFVIDVFFCCHKRLLWIVCKLIMMKWNFPKWGMAIIAKGAKINDSQRPTSNIVKPFWEWCEWGAEEKGDKNDVMKKRSFDFNAIYAGIWSLTVYHYLGAVSSDNGVVVKPIVMTTARRVRFVCQT